MRAPVLSGLLVGLAVLALINWWRFTIHILVVQFTHRPFLTRHQLSWGRTVFAANVP